MGVFMVKIIFKSLTLFMILSTKRFIPTCFGGASLKFGVIWGPDSTQSQLLGPLQQTRKNRARAGNV